MMSRAAPGVRRDWGDNDDGCTILHVDMDAFFAAVELVRRPHLHGRPVIVGGQERSVVLSATYEARAFGIHSAMPMAIARRRCPDAVVVSPDHAAYREASRQVMATLCEFTPLVEQISVDEAFLDVSGARRRFGNPAKIATDIRARIRAEHQLPCSVGVASTKFVAKIASGYAKPDGMVVIPVDATLEFLHSLPITALWGVGEQTAKQLARWGITSVAELATTERSVVQQAVGVAVGAHLHDLAHGRDPRPVTPTRVEKSIGAERTFAQDTSDLTELEQVLVDLSSDCARRLRAQGKVARTVGIKVKLADFTVVSRSRSLVAGTDIGREIFLLARDLLATLDLRKPVRLVGVRTENLDDVVRVGYQPTLDESTGPDRREVEVAIDDVRAKFGSAALVPGTSIRGRLSDPQRS
jgi:DNA polymerase-4